MDNLKEQMYEAMIDFIAVERKIEALIDVLHILQEHFEYKDKEYYSVISTITWQIEMIYQELKKDITAIDVILLNKNNTLNKKENEHEQEEICE